MSILDATQAATGHETAQPDPKPTGAVMPTPREVILAALCADISGRESTNPDVVDRAELIENALIEYGHLAAPEAPMTDADVDRMAQELADASGHPRYRDSDEGWRKLLQSDADVELAYASAARNAPQSASEELLRVKTHLLAAGAARRASGAGA